MIKKLDDMEQRTKRTNIRIYGLEECVNTNLEDTVKQIIDTNFNLTPNIEHCYRIGQQHPGNDTETKPRAVLIQLSSYKDKCTILKSRKVLKGKNLYVAEDLTKKRYEILRKAKLDHRPIDVFTRDGGIYYKEDGKIHRVA